MSLLKRSSPDAARVVGGRWQLIERLAEGGMGTIYVARHRQTGREAAVKVIEAARPEALARFHIEASVSADVRHPGIVDVLDADLDGGSTSCFIAMELLRGRTLRAVMDEPSTTPQRVIDLLCSALEPLAAAHAKGYVHRDLKPENLFVLDDEGDGPRVKLLDFGIAAQQGADRITRTGTAMGTPHYMSPEQAVNARVAGPTADVWAVGVMVYEAIAGELPFQGETAHGIVVRACTAEHVPLADRVREVDGAIAALVDRCLSKNAASRPADAAVLLEELRTLARRPRSLPARRPRPPSARPAATRSETRTAVAAKVTGRPPAGIALMAAGVTALGASLLALVLDQFTLPQLLPWAGLFGVCGVVGAMHVARRRRGADLPHAGIPTLPLPSTTEPQEPVAVRHPVRGSANAPVEIEIVIDVASAVARRTCQRVLALGVEHPGDVRFVFKPVPDSERELSWQAAELLRDVFERCGGPALWELVDRVVALPTRLTLESLEQLSRDVGAPVHELRRALRARHRQRVVTATRAEADARGAFGNPAVFMQGRLLTEDLTAERLRWALYDALQDARNRRVPTVLSSTAATEPPPSGPHGRRVLVRSLLVRFQGARNAPPSLRRGRGEAHERALRLRARAALAGAEFSVLASRFADEVREPFEIDLDAVDPTLADAIATLELGAVSGLLERDDGYHLFQRVS